MKIEYHYASVSKALEELKELGFDYDYNLNEKEIIMDPDNYIIHHVYRYEGNTNPDDEAIVYGISSFDNKKGVFVAGYSANSNAELTKALQRIISRDIQ